jgi:hypothetical protein
MENEYIFEDGEPIGVKGEKTIKEKWFNFNNFDFKVLVTSQPKDSNGEKYHNFYIISMAFKQEPLNTLDVQEPSDIVEKMTDKELLRFMEERAIGFYLWYKYNRTYSIDSEEIPQ